MMWLKSRLALSLMLSLSLHGLLLLESPLIRGRVGSAQTPRPGSSAIDAYLMAPGPSSSASRKISPQVSMRRGSASPPRVKAAAQTPVSASELEEAGELSVATWSAVEFRLRLAEAMQQQPLPSLPLREWWVRLSVSRGGLGALSFSDATVAGIWQSSLSAAIHQLRQRSDWPQSPLVIELNFLSTTTLDQLP